jgi:hypothetical protein
MSQCLFYVVSSIYNKMNKNLCFMKLWHLVRHVHSGHVMIGMYLASSPLVSNRYTLIQ